MGWTSSELRIEMMNNDAAETAVEAIKRYIVENAAHYDTLNMENFMADLSVEDNLVVLDDSYSMHGWDYMTFVPDICKVLAEDALIKSFKGTASYCSGYGDEGVIEVSYENSTLHLNSITYPMGFCEYLYCEECGEGVVPIEEYEEGKLYICPKCGEEIDLTDAYENYKPEVKEIIISIQ